MRTPRLRRIVWVGVLVCLVPVAVFLSVAYSGGPVAGNAGNAGTRGAQRPQEASFSLFAPASWSTPAGTPRDWYDMGMDAVTYGDFNPWKKVRHQTYGQRWKELCRSKDPADEGLEELERQRGKEWRDRILARHPDLAVKYREVPDERNGLWRLRQLSARLGDGTFQVLDKLIDPAFFNPRGLDLATARSWVEANRELLAEFRLIGSLEERSSRGLDGAVRFAGDLAHQATIALLVDARVAMENGDVAATLADVRAARGLAAHVLEADVMSYSYSSWGTAMMGMVNRYTLMELMPRVPAGQLDPAAWEKAVDPQLERPAAFANRIRAEWYQLTASHLLPALAVDMNPPPDTDLLVESYTSQMAALARVNDSIGLADLSSTVRSMDESGLSWRAKQVSRELSMTWEPGPSGELYDPRQSWVQDQQRTGLYQAAFAILNGKPAPVDPVSGAPYIWNPATRELWMPEGWNPGLGLKPIRLPRP